MKVKMIERVPTTRRLPTLAQGFGSGALYVVFDTGMNGDFKGLALTDGHRNSGVRAGTIQTLSSKEILPEGTKIEIEA